MMTMQHKIKEVPGLAFVVESMELMSAAGRRRMLEQPFLTGMAELEYEQTAVATLRQRLETTTYSQPLNVLRHQLMQLHDLRTTLGSLRSHVVLSEVELFEVKNLAFLCGHSRRALAELEADNLFDLPDLTEVFHLLDPDHTGIPNFYIYDSYDSRLAPLRRQMKEADDQLMGELLAKHNDIQQQVIERLCDQLHPYADKLTKALEQMAYIDFTLARATLAQQWKLQRPDSMASDDDAQPLLLGLFNPRLKQHNEAVGLRYQPIDIGLAKGVTLVTGANMAGKTVLLKSIGVAQLMYQFGFPIPATSARMKAVDDVVFCIGDEQNEMNGLSSYAAEITRISDVMKRSESEHLLVLIDEPARTTNPVEGKALVQAIATIMQQRESFTMITTHYSQLGVECRRLRVKGFVENMADMPLTAQTINRFIDYSLVTDTSDEVPQEALRIAELLDCHPEMIRQARLHLLH
jgi:dsDNA-specific endonuclease/ATPase MutS2